MSNHFFNSISVRLIELLMEEKSPSKGLCIGTQEWKGMFALPIGHVSTVIFARALIRLTFGVVDWGWVIDSLAPACSLLLLS